MCIGIIITVGSSLPLVYMYHAELLSRLEAVKDMFQQQQQRVCREDVHTFFQHYGFSRSSRQCRE